MTNPNQFLLYTAPDGVVRVEVFYQDETVWLTQKALAELFGVGVPAINKHLKNIYDSGELSRGQLFPKWKQFVPKVPVRSSARWSSTTSTPSSRLATASTASRPLSSASGPHRHCASSSPKASCSMTNG